MHRGMTQLLLSEEQHGFVEIMNDILDLSNIEANEFEMGTATSLSPTASPTWRAAWMPSAAGRHTPSTFRSWMCRKKCTTRLKALLLSALHSLVSNTCETPTSTYRINTLPHLQHLISWMAWRLIATAPIQLSSPTPQTPQVIDCNNSSSNCVDGGWPTAALDYMVDATRQWGGLAAETPFFPYLQRQSRHLKNHESFYIT
ncbi:unnamed protein product [Closterium sp. NIES-65]|nr:unnamed protein product [Closterium sp. NIES-65]